MRGSPPSPSDVHALDAVRAASLPPATRRKASGCCVRSSRSTPRHLPAYDLLGRALPVAAAACRGTGRVRTARARRPESTGARTMVATLLHLQNRVDEARQQYEAIVQTSTDAAVASNNLAWLYATSGGNLDVALSAGAVGQEGAAGSAGGERHARLDLLPQGPVTASRLDALEQSVQKDPDNALYLYHLGMTLRRAGRPRQGSPDARARARAQPTVRRRRQARRVSVELSQPSRVRTPAEMAFASCDQRRGN